MRDILLCGLYNWLSTEARVKAATGNLRKRVFHFLTQSVSALLLSLSKKPAAFYFFFIDNTERKLPIFPFKEQGVTAAAKVISGVRLLCCNMFWDIQHSITLRRSREHWQVFFFSGGNVAQCNQHVYRLMKPDETVWCTVNRSYVTCKAYLWCLCWEGTLHRG